MMLDIPKPRTRAAERSVAAVECQVKEAAGSRRRNLRQVYGSYREANTIMAKTRSKPMNMDEYITGAPLAVHPISRDIRRVIRAAAPEAEEMIRYRVPAFKQHGILVLFAAAKNHIERYPPVSRDATFQKALEPYATQRAISSSHWTGRIPTL